jgi:Rieske Fe-S protein
LTVILISACSRERQVPIPYVYVNYTVYLNNPSSSNLRVPGGYSYINGQGNHGIFLYRRTLGDREDFIALDRTCSHEPLGNCIVELDDTEFYLVCPCCGSKFSVFDGYPAEGPAKWPLREYQTSLGSNTLRIYN